MDDTTIRTCPDCGLRHSERLGCEKAQQLADIDDAMLRNAR